jgi:RNA polymerase sigma-70 factor (ECF subfamily)
MSARPNDFFPVMPIREFPMSAFVDRVQGLGRSLVQVFGLAAEEEASLVERCKRGDEEAFNELLSAHQQRILNVAYRLTNNYDEALDLTQEVLLRCFRNIHQFKGDSALTTWLYRITVNLARNRWKYNRVRGLHRQMSLDAPLEDSDDDVVRFAVDGQPLPSEVAAGRESFQIFEEALKKLDPEWREILVLRHIENLEYDRIAEILEIQLGTVKSRLNRARAALRAVLPGELA